MQLSRVQEGRFPPSVWIYFFGYTAPRGYTGCGYSCRECRVSRGVSQSEIARRAGVRQPSVHKALRAGWLTAEPDGTIDPERSENARWVRQHQQGWDNRSRPLSTYPRAAPPPVLFDNWDEIPVDVVATDRLLDIVRDGGDPVALIVGLMDSLRREVAKALTAQQAEIAELRRALDSRS